MRRVILIVALFPLLSSAQQKTENFKLVGSFKNAPADIDWIFFSYSVDGERKTDSVRLKNGRYRFKGKIAEPVLATLSVRYKTSPDGKVKALKRLRDVAGVFLEKGKINIASTDSISNATIKGSEANNEYVRLNKASKPYYDKMNVLSVKYNKYRGSKDEPNLKKTEEELAAVDKELIDTVFGNYIRSNPASPIIMYVLKQFAGWEIDAEKVEPVFNLLPAAVHTWPSAVKLKAQIEIAKKTGIGKDAIDFTQNDTLGIPVSLSSFRGKYVLIDFWASWCGPCRQENPHVVKAFQRFKEKGFYILGVSLDREGQKERWIKAIHDDKLEWTHVSDLKYWKNEVAVMYGVVAIPQNLLIDPEGKIIAKNLRGDELDKKLEEFIVQEKKLF